MDCLVHLPKPPMPEALPNIELLKAYFSFAWEMQ